MSENANEVDESPERQQRGRRAPARPAKRRFRVELEALQGRVAMARRLLGKAKDAKAPEAVSELLEAVAELLED